MRDYLDNILSVIQAESLTDEEFASVSLPLPPSVSEAMYFTLKGILEGRENVSTVLVRLRRYFMAAGVELSKKAEQHTPQTQIFIGASLSGPMPSYLAPRPSIAPAPPAQQVIIGTFVNPTKISAAGGIPVTSDLNVKRYIAGDGGNIDITKNPQIDAGTDGQKITLVGTSDDHRVLLENGNGLIMDGPFNMGLGSVITFGNNGVNWIEEGRNQLE